MQVFNFALDRLTNASLRWPQDAVRDAGTAGCICAVGFSYAEEPVAAQHAVAVQESVAEQEPLKKNAAGATHRCDDRRDGSLHGTSLPARVDTGATSCSIHCVAMEIKDAA